MPDERVRRVILHDVPGRETELVEHRRSRIDMSVAAADKGRPGLHEYKVSGRKLPCRKLSWSIVDDALPQFDREFNLTKIVD